MRNSLSFTAKLSKDFKGIVFEEEPETIYLYPRNTTRLIKVNISNTKQMISAAKILLELKNKNTKI